jgi:UPF0755 protein
MKHTSAQVRKKRRGAPKFLLILILLLAIAVGCGGAYTLGLRPVEPGNEEPVTVEIPNGSGASAIVDILDEAGLVKNKFWAKVNTKIGGYDSLQANTYVFNKGMSFNAIMSAINEGDFDYISRESIEVRDGARLEQVAAAISEQLPFTADEIMDKWNDKAYLKELIDRYWFLTDDILDKDITYPLEGYLYADTYYVTSDNSTIEGFTEMCLDRMQEELDVRRDAIESSKFSVHELLTLASIVTKEAAAEDQAGVAGVFMNRIDKGMSLGSDVTVCYIFQEDRVDLKQSQLDSDSPYNTRKHAGLPPGPICQIIGASVDAVLKPQDNDYLFFYAGPDGTVYYANTEAEHEANVAAHPWSEEDLAQ